MMVSCGFFLLIGAISTHLLHTAETASAISPLKVQYDLTDAELKQFGEACYKLPYVLWINVLDFLLGDYHGIIFGIDPRAISNLQQSNRIKIDDYGRLIACYNRRIYAWSPCGNHIISKKSWYTQAIPKGWSLDRFENGSIVFLNDNRNEMRILDDVTFKKQSHYQLPKNSYFWIGNKGRTLVHCAHPLLIKAPILNMYVVKQQRGKQGNKIQKSSQQIRMPQGGVMPPITLNESGTMLATHATESDELYIIDLQVACKSSSISPRKILLSDCDINTQRIDFAMWKLIHPVTHTHDEFMLAVSNNSITHHSQSMVAILPAPDTQDVPFLPIYFAQTVPRGYKNYRFVGELNFIKGTSPKKGHLITSLSVSKNCTEHDNKEESLSLNYTFRYWDTITGNCLQSLKFSSKDNGIPEYSVGRQGRIAACNHTECNLLTPPSNVRSLRIDEQRGQIGNVRISPSGDWVFHYNHMLSQKSSYILAHAEIHYLGGERMKKNVKDSKIDQRKWMMRLYALQQTCERNTEALRPPEEMQKAIGMKFAVPTKYGSNITTKIKDSCIIS
jgi:hypothetical protein